MTAIEAAGRIVMPGLINAHSHSYTALLKGTVDAVPLDLYMIRAIAGGGDRTPREIFVSAQVDCITLLKSGVTSVIDHYSERPQTTAEGLEAVAAGYREAGLRARIAPMFADLPYLDTVPIDASRLPGELRDFYGRMRPPDAEAYFATVDRALETLDTGSGRIGLLLGVDGPQRCSDALIEMTADAKKRTGSASTPTCWRRRPRPRCAALAKASSPGSRGSASSTKKAPSPISSGRRMTTSPPRATPG